MTGPGQRLAYLPAVRLSLRGRFRADRVDSLCLGLEFACSLFQRLFWHQKRLHEIHGTEKFREIHRTIIRAS